MNYHKFEASLVFIESSRPVRATLQDSISRNQRRRGGESRERENRVAGFPYPLLGLVLTRSPMVPFLSFFLEFVSEEPAFIREGCKQYLSPYFPRHDSQHTVFVLLKLHQRKRHEGRACARTLGLLLIH